MSMVGDSSSVGGADDKEDESEAEADMVVGRKLYR